jgi:hypothetical protein
LTITGADGAVSVVLHGAAGSLVLPFAAEPLRPGHLLAALPRGIAAGRYDVVVTDRDGRSEPAGRLEVVDAVTSVAEAATVVTAQGDGARLEVADGGGAGLPAAYLVPSGAAESAVAIRLAGVARRASGTLEVGTAGATLEPGDYDLLLVGAGRDGTGAEARLAPRALRVAPSGAATPELAPAEPGLLAPRPAIVAVSLVPAETGGLAAGTWHYRIAAMLRSSGETVASEPAGVDVPGGAGQPVGIEVAWARVEGAVGYRVYRTAAAGDPAGTERLIAETRADAASFVDDGKPVEPVP